jgi:hypothetical protein
VSCGLPSAAFAEAPSAAFALLVGVNQSADAGQPTLRYADDDAALYFALFRTLGARTYLLMRADENTRRLHPQAIAESRLPLGSSLEDTVTRLRGDVAQARAQGVKTVFYFVYAGHGDVKDGRGTIALEDRQLGGQELVRIVDRVGADQAHMIIDACYSFYLAYDRGPGGSRRPFPGLKRFGALAERSQIGLLLSTSSARESHEWEGFQAGVFSHEVRSGLYGAADADGDGLVSYREIAAFVERANAAIPNERFRPDVYARPPTSTAQFLDLRASLARHVVLPPGRHYILESGAGVRVAELHNAAPARLLRPMLLQPLFVRAPEGDEEFLLSAAPDVIDLATLKPQSSRALERGAAHESFSAIFSLPFGRASVGEFRFRALPNDTPEERLRARLEVTRRIGWAGVALGAASLLSGLGLSLASIELHGQGIAGRSQLEVATRNAQIDRQNVAAYALYGVAGALALTGTLLLTVPRRSPRLTLTASLSGGMLSFGSVF